MLGLFNKVKQKFKKPQIDEPVEAQREQALSDPFVQNGTFLLSEGCDEIPNAKGQFGRDRNNPIPVNSVVGEFIYLERLRGKNDVTFLYHRLGSTVSSISGNNVDIYELVSCDAEHWDILYLDPYYTYRSKKSPDGFYLKKWDEYADFEQDLMKHCCLLHGVNGRVENFPFGLLDIIGKRLDEMLPGFNAGKSMRDALLSLFNKIPAEKWINPHGIRRFTP
jgi:hypothetical protein